MKQTRTRHNPNWLRLQINGKWLDVYLGDSKTRIGIDDKILTGEYGVELVRCPRCRRVLKPSDYHHDASRKTGFRNACVTCNKASRKKGME